MGGVEGGKIAHADGPQTRRWPGQEAEQMHVSHDPAAPAANPITFEQFLAVDIRVGRILTAEPFPQARKPAYRLTIDFGPTVGVKRSSAQLTERYTTDALIGRMVAAVVNFPPRQIGPFMSQVLTLGFPDEEGAVVLVAPDADIPLGGRLF
jgi:tRNA-binding protein